MGNFITNDYKLDITPQGNYPVVYLSQHEDGRDIRFLMLNKGKLLTIQSGISAFVSGLKSNGGYYEHLCTVDGSYVIMPVEADMTDVSGRGVANIKLTNESGDKVISAKFVVNVQESVSDNGIVVPVVAETILQQILNEIRAYASSLNIGISQLRRDLDAEISSFESDINESVDTLDARIDEFIAGQSGTSNGTLITTTNLYTGDGTAASISLSGNPANYDYLEIWYRINGRHDEVQTIPALKLGNGISLRVIADIQNTVTPVAGGVVQSPAELLIYEFRLTKDTNASGYVYNLSVVPWSWTGAHAEDSEVSTVCISGSGITSIKGIKYTDAGTSKDSELVDIRVGTDGTTYQTAGAAVRAQIENVESGLVTVDTELSDTSENPVQNKVISERIGNLSDVINSAFVVDSVSGGMAHFVDGADDVPLKSLKINIEPVQSGSGDPSPTNIRPITGWRAVKATRTRKNLAAPFAPSSGTYSGKVVTFEENSHVIITGEANAGNSDTPIKYFGGNTPAPINLESGKTYTLSVQGKFEVSHPSIAVPEVRVRLMDAGNAIIWSDNNAEGKWTFTPESDFVAERFSIRFARQGTVIDVDGYLQFEVGSEATEYEPYSGDVYKVLLSDGENHFDIDSVYADESKFTIVGDSVSGTATDFASTSFTIPSELVGKPLRFSIDAEVGETPNYIRASATVAGLTYNGEMIEANTSGSSSVLFTPTSTDDEVKIVYGSSGSGVIKVSKIRLEVANFVYGGILDVVSGEFVVDNGIVTFDGSEDGWFLQSGKRCAISNALPGVALVDGNNRVIGAMANEFVERTPNISWNGTIGFSIESTGRLVVRQFTTDTRTLDSWKTWLSTHNLQVVYPLINPQTYQLTPQQVNSLLGVNNIWSDVGDVDVEYRADTKLYIDKKVQEALML